MKNILDSIEKLLKGGRTFKEKMVILANDAGIDTRYRDGVPHDLVNLIRKQKRGFEQLQYVEFVLVMLTLMVRSYMGKNDSDIIIELDDSWQNNFSDMTIAEKLFYALLKFRLGEVMFESENIPDNKPVTTALIGYGDLGLIEAGKHP